MGVYQLYLHYNSTEIWWRPYFKLSPKYLLLSSFSLSNFLFAIWFSSLDRYEIQILLCVYTLNLCQKLKKNEVRMAYGVCNTHSMVRVHEMDTFIFLVARKAFVWVWVCAWIYQKAKFLFHMPWHNNKIMDRTFSSLSSALPLRYPFYILNFNHYI